MESYINKTVPSNSTVGSVPPAAFVLCSEDAGPTLKYIQATCNFVLFFITLFVGVLDTRNGSAKWKRVLFILSLITGVAASIWTPLGFVCKAFKPKAEDVYDFVSLALIKVLAVPALPWYSWRKQVKEDRAKALEKRREDLGLELDGRTSDSTTRTEPPSSDASLRGRMSQRTTEV